MIKNEQKMFFPRTLLPRTAPIFGLVFVLISRTWLQKKQKKTEMFMTFLSEIYDFSDV